MINPFHNKINSNDSPMYGEENHLEITAAPRHILNALKAPPELLPHFDETHPKPKLKFISADDLAKNVKPTEWVIKGLLPKDSNGIIYGASMTFKTFVALGISHSICTGKPFMEHAVKQIGGVIYLYGEGAGGIARRVRGQVIKNGSFNNNLHILDFDTAVRIDDNGDMSLLKEAIEELKPVLVIIDTFASLVSSTNENDNGDVGKVLNLIRQTCRNGFTSSMVVHHTGKDENNGARGAYAFTGNTDFQFELVRKDKAPITTMHCRKQKESVEFEPFSMRAEVIPLDIYDEDDGKEETTLVLIKSDAPATTAKSLDNEHRKILAVLNSVIDNDGIMPPKSVIDLFPDNPEKAPKKVTTVSTWLDASFDVITGTGSDDEKAKKKAKTEKHRRTRVKFEELGIIGVHGDYVWIANALQPA